MKRFFYTYGSDPDEDGQPFMGGWSEVHSESQEEADTLFRLVHPCRNNSTLLNCAGVYTEGAFTKTEMYRRGNFGNRCHEVIELTVTKGDKDHD